jgi:hypothetical protein
MAKWSEIFELSKIRLLGLIQPNPFALAAASFPSPFNMALA